MHHVGANCGADAHVRGPGQDDDEKYQMPAHLFSQVGGGDLLSREPSFRAHGVKLVNEPGLYSLILRSRKPRAKEFKRWITHEVLPSIRQTENYVPSDGGLADALARGDTSTLALLVKGSVSVIEDLEWKNAVLRPLSVAGVGAEAHGNGQTAQEHRP